MGFFNGFVDKLGETLQDAGWFVGAPVAAAIDIAKAAIPGGTPLTKGALNAVTQGFDRGTQLFMGDSSGPDAGTQNLVSGVTKPVMDSLEWVYDNAIAQPINFLNIETQRGLADVAGVQDNADFTNFGSAWDRADETHGGYNGQGTSIGRETAYTLEALKGATLGTITNAIPDALTRGEDVHLSLPQRMASLTDEGQKALNEGKGMVGRSFDLESGGTDLVARWYLDPTIVAGKGMKALRLAKVIAGVKDPAELTTKLAQQKDGLFAGFGQRHDAAIKFAMAPNRNAGELLASFPGLRESVDGESVASILEQTNKTMRAADKSDQEIYDQAKLITRASMGDSTALKSIDESAAFAKDALAAMRSDRDDLKTAADWAVQYGDNVTPDQVAEKARNLDLAGDLALRGRDYFTSDEFLKLTNARLKSVDKDIQAAQAEAARQQRVRNLFVKKTDDQGNLVPTSKFGQGADQPMLASAIGASTKGLEKRAARERGENVGLDFVFQSTAWNKGVKFVAPHIYLAQKASAAYRKMAAPPVINVEDERAGQALDTWLKHSSIDPETRLKLVSQMAQNTSMVRRGQVVDQAIKLGVESIITAAKKEDPFFSDEAEKLVRTAIAKQAAQDGTRAGVQNQMFTAAKRTEDTEAGAAGTRGDMTIGDDGMAHFYPVLPSQITKLYGMPNLREAKLIVKKHSSWVTDMAEWARGNRAPDPKMIEKLGEKFFGGAGEKFPKLADKIANNSDDRLNSINDFGWKSYETGKMMLNSFNRLWKIGTLATRPIAYTMRVNVDSSMRMAAALGPAAFMMHALPRDFGYATLLPTGIKMFRRARQDDAQLLKLKTDMERFEDAYAGETGKKLVPGVSAEYDAFKADHDAIAARLDQFKNGGRKGRRAAYGVFAEPGRKSIQTRAGEIPGAFTTEQGKLYQWLISNETTADLLDDSNKLAWKDAQIGNWTYVQNTDPNHMSAWLGAINHQLMQTDVGKEAVRLMVENDGDMAKSSAALTKWAIGTPEGRKLMGELVWTAADKRAYTNEIIGYVNHYLPTPELRQIAKEKGRVAPTDLETAFPDPIDRPPVHGESLAIAVNRGSLLGAQVNQVVKRIMHWAGAGTEDQLARHPMYAAVYEQEAKRRAEFLMADPNISKLGLDDIKTLIQDQAHNKARQTIKDYMFDIAHTSDLTHFMQYSSPFIAAWEDTVRKWGRLVKENPQLVGQFDLAWNAPNAMGMVVDSDGNPVEKDGIFGYTDPKTGEHKATYLVIPRGLTKWIPGAGDSELKISKQSLNIVLQGGLQPGFGPLIAYPIAKIQTWSPQVDQVASIVNPYGPPSSVWDAMAPTTLKAVYDATHSQSLEHEKDTRRIWAQMLAEYRLDPQKFGGKQPTIDEAAQRAGALGRLKIWNRVVGMVPGFPAIFQSPYQFYIDSYHTLQQQENDPRLGHPHGWADDQFLQMYGDTYFPLVQSQTLNNGGVGASAEAVDALKKFSPLISQYGMEAGKANPALIRLIVGQEGEGDFNQSAYLWEQTHEISPGSSVMYRSYKDPQAAQAAAESDLGWLKYRQKMQELDARAIQEGYRTYADDPALADERKQFITSLEKDNNSWRIDWNTRDDDKFQRDLDSLGQIANSDKFGPMRTDMTGAKQYLALRQALTDELTQYGVGFQSKEAQPFRQEFTDAVMDLVSSNSQFAEWTYYTFLDRDPLLEPVTSQNQPTDQAPTDWGIS